MASVEASSTVHPLNIDPILIKAVVGSVQKGLDMCGTKAHCVSLSSVPNRESGTITGLIGVHGRVSGFVTVNMAEPLAIRMVEGLLMDKFGKLTSQVIDGAGELTNIIVGGIKSALAGTPWAFLNITVPSVIVGKGYQISYTRGLDFICAAFECDDNEVIMLEDRLIQVSLSLLRL